MSKFCFYFRFFKSFSSKILKFLVQTLLFEWFKQKSFWFFNFFSKNFQQKNIRKIFYYSRKNFNKRNPKFSKWKRSILPDLIWLLKRSFKKMLFDLFDRKWPLTYLTGQLTYLTGQLTYLTDRSIDRSMTNRQKPTLH
jgi:hypothetical protein